jgi:3'-phosphoadenosine 5'-phosphosulfate sulfotransferase (PAPS reductase)/FAD synthetase
MTQLIADMDTGDIAPERTGRELLDDVIAKHNPLAVLALFSGGHDSLVSTHLTAQHPAFTAVLHINTGIGIEETREFVRETCRKYGWPLIEATTTTDYDARSLAKGMPGGPVAHQSMYHLLKRDPMMKAIREIKAGRRGLVALSTGIRTAESARRMRLHAEATKVDRTGIWVNPIQRMTGSDVNQYIADHNLLRNPVTDKLHRSGECLCGALAHPDELKEIEFWYPEVGQRIRNLERECFVRGLRWQWGSKQVTVADERQAFMPMCHSCELQWDTLNTPIVTQG